MYCTLNTSNFTTWEEKTDIWTFGRQKDIWSFWNWQKTFGACYL